jgi:hypothetical protein
MLRYNKENKLKRIPSVILCLLLFVFLVYSSVVIAESPSSEKRRGPINRDVWMVFYKNSMRNLCENPSSPPMCLAKTKDICRKYWLDAYDECDKTFKNKIPSEINRDDISKWSIQLGRCAVANFKLLAGADGIDMKRCQEKKP